MYIKDCSKKITSAWYNVTSCPSLAKMLLFLPTPHCQRIRFSVFLKVVMGGVTHPHSPHREARLTHSMLLR